jgi:hypothetical protein
MQGKPRHDPPRAAWMPGSQANKGIHFLEGGDQVSCSAGKLSRVVRRSEHEKAPPLALPWSQTDRFLTAATSFYCAIG